MQRCSAPAHQCGSHNPQHVRCRFCIRHPVERDPAASVFSSKESAPVHQRCSAFAQRHSGCGVQDLLPSRAPAIARPVAPVRKRHLRRQQLPYHVFQLKCPCRYALTHWWRRTQHMGAALAARSAGAGSPSVSSSVSSAGCCAGELQARFERMCPLPCWHVGMASSCVSGRVWTSWLHLRNDSHPRFRATATPLRS